MEPPLCHLNKWRRGTGRGGTDLSISYHPAFLLLAGDSVRLRPLANLGYEWFTRHRLTIGRLFGRNCDTGTCALPAAKSPKK